MYALKPDVVNGQKVFRMKAQGGGPNFMNDALFLPPSMKLAETRFQPWDELLHHAMAQLITVADHADPVLKLQAAQSKAKLAKHQSHWLRVAAQNERARIRDHLRSLGFKEAAEAIKNG